MSLEALGFEKPVIDGKGHAPVDTPAANHGLLFSLQGLAAAKDGHKVRFAATKHMVM
jgi:hypothetical protein